MFERAISAREIRADIESGEVIEESPEDRPFPTTLLLGSASGVPLHLVVASDQAERCCIIVTVYRRNPRLWEPGFRNRRPS
jgi:hypothetical protein